MMTEKKSLTSRAATPTKEYSTFREYHCRNSRSRREPAETRNSNGMTFFDRNWEDYEVLVAEPSTTEGQAPLPAPQYKKLVVDDDDFEFLTLNISSECSSVKSVCSSETELCSKCGSDKHIIFSCRWAVDEEDAFCMRCRKFGGHYTEDCWADPYYPDTCSSEEIEEGYSQPKYCPKCRCKGHYAEDCWYKSSNYDTSTEEEEEEARDVAHVVAKEEEEAHDVAHVVQCRECSQYGHYDFECFNNDSEDTDEMEYFPPPPIDAVECALCHRKGHVASQCGARFRFKKKQI